MPTTDQMEKSFNSYATCTKNSITRRLATVTLLIVALLITACVESNEPIPTVSASMTRTEPTNTVAPESTPLAPAPVPTPTATTAAQT
ncbi:MAG: hypothetical protein OTJ43_09050, partial [Dehalococcoidia bacterium]|nr:hypothetical protein [Dehalococcoidia bacterium]